MRVHKSAGSGTLTAAGTTNTIPKYTGATTLGNSSVTDNGTKINAGEPIGFSASTRAIINAIFAGLGQDEFGALYTSSASPLTVGGNLNLGAKVVQVNAINTSGAIGIPAIYKAYQSGSQNAALTAVGSYTPPATAGMYRATINCYVTVGTTCSFSIKVNYQDLNGTAHADIFQLAAANTAGFLLNNLVVAAGTYYSIPVLVNIDNSATPITFSTVGTFTAVTYFLNATLEQLG